MQLPPVEQQVSHHDFRLWKIVEEKITKEVYMKNIKLNAFTNMLV